MHGLIMDFQLTLPAIVRRADALFGSVQIVSRLPDRSLHRIALRELLQRSRRLASALRHAGIKDGDRVGTLCWNHHEHLEAYFGIPAAGAVLHTLNLRLHPDELAYIINHAADRMLVVDATLLPLFETIRSKIGVDRVLVVAQGQPVPGDCIDYESFLGTGSDEVDGRDVGERQAAAMCYTTGTTGKPNGVLYSHRAIVLHSLASALTDVMAISERDTVVPVVPMFHANAWGLPFTCMMTGSKQVFPGPYLDPASLADLMAREKATLAAGVPTLWMGLLQLLDKDPDAYDLSALRALIVGGSAAPLAMIRGFYERHGLKIVHAWGMTETAPLGSISNLPPDVEHESIEAQYAVRAKQGRPAPFIEVRARGENGLVPWDGQSMGELEVRGAWVASAYYENDAAGDRFTDDGWFKTGDVVTIDPRGFIEIQDRAKDLIKSGGEWISSVALENALMGHPSVAEAAVVAVPHPRWTERPVAAVVLKEGQTATASDLRAFLAPHFANWWLPEDFVFLPSIPRSSAGKFLKSALRQQFRDRFGDNQGLRTVD